MKKKCLIVGVPSSGKSTYIAALWYSVTTYENCSLIASDNLPENTAYLDDLMRIWLSFKQVRTIEDITDQIEFNLKDKETGNEFTVMLPDFKGETFIHMLEGISNKGLQNWLHDAESVILMIKDLEFVKFSSIDEKQASLAMGTGHSSQSLVEAQASLTAADDDNDINKFSLFSMSGASQNLLLLKYLKENMNIKKLIVCVTAWDQTESKGSSLAYFKKASIGLYQYIVNNFKSVEFYGLSAQGAAYPEKDASSDEKETIENSLITKTENGKRAYVIEKDKKVFDVTIPLKNAIVY